MPEPLPKLKVVIGGKSIAVWTDSDCAARAIFLDDRSPHSEALAHLLAAGPDLLRACEAAEDALVWYGEDKPVAANALKEIRAAIAKAAGRGGGETK